MIDIADDIWSSSFTARLYTFRAFLLHGYDSYERLEHSILEQFSFKIKKGQTIAKRSFVFTKYRTIYRNADNKF